MSRRTYVIGLVAALLLGLALRAAWLSADSPNDAHGGVAIVWHDEGAWVHNARNRALWGVWRTDNWNPVYIAPVFTELESIAFRAFGVGTWQARTVPAASGFVAILFLALGLQAAASRRTALIGSWLLAANYIFVMWNRAALMESTLTMWIVIAWAAYAMSATRPRWAIVAGIAVVLAWFTKASAAFFVVAIGIDAAISLWAGYFPAATHSLERPDPRLTERADARSAVLMLAGMATAGVVIIALFVLPHWREYQFYNWQMTVTRKPDYSLHAFKTNASWLPIESDFFTRMWLVLVAAALATLAILRTGITARPAARLLVLWFFVGLAELVVHGAGEERYYVPLIPALIALAAMFLGSGPRWQRESNSTTGTDDASMSRWIAAPIVLALGYLIFGSVVRLGFLDQLAQPHPRFSNAVYLAAALGVVAGAMVIWRWDRVTRTIIRTRLSPYVAAAVVVIAVGWNISEYASWARSRVYLNYWASVELGGLLPPGTLVHGKLANGLSLNNRIKPLFIGTHFGNYDDRFERDDARYVLTYITPYLGYESGTRGTLIQELIDHYPAHRMLATFSVNETGGNDRAALFDKFPAQRDVVKTAQGLGR